MGGDSVGPNSASDTREWVEIRVPTGLLRVNFSELWRHREVARSLALRELRSRYKQTALGIGWVVVQPLAAVAIFSLIFGEVVDVPSEGLPYPVFVYSGLVLWTFFSTSVGGAATSLVANREIVMKVYFPRVLAPVASVIPRLVDLGVSLLVFLVVMLAYGVTPTATIVTLPLWIAATVALSIGVGSALAALNVRFRDIGHGLGFLLQLWLYASPVVFPGSLIDGTERWLLAINPVVGLIDGVRWSLVSGPAPPTADLVSFAVGVLMIAGGLFYFQRAEAGFADVI